MKRLITGGAGFIGSNAVARSLDRGEEVVVIDNLSRRGAHVNLSWLTSHPNAKALAFHQVDIRDDRAVTKVFKEHPDVDVVIHLAGQVAVTTSVQDPRGDFEANALGTLNLLEASRHHRGLRAFLYSSTNKVYGGLENVGVIEADGRYQFRDAPLGIPETYPLDFHSPYGCSKGAADQYTIDYARIYGLPSVALRQSCIYGPRQLGVEDQGWVAWFTIAAVTGRPISIFGDGKQVRDVLFVDDLLDAYDAAVRKIDTIRGTAINLGGGPENTLAIGEVLAHIGPRIGKSVPANHADWRPGDQRVFIADITRARQVLDWAPRVSVTEGLDRLLAWVQANQELFGLSRTAPRTGPISVPEGTDTHVRYCVKGSG